jgi:hypothetical protein
MSKIGMLKNLLLACATHKPDKGLLAQLRLKGIEAPDAQEPAEKQCPCYHNVETEGSCRVSCTASRPLRSLNTLQA